MILIKRTLNDKEFVVNIMILVIVITQLLYYRMIKKKLHKTMKDS